MAKPGTDKQIKTTLRVPEILWKEILVLAIVENTSAQAIVTTALQDYIKARPRATMYEATKAIRSQMAKGGK
jgi:hypothetical protein